MNADSIRQMMANRNPGQPMSTDPEIYRGLALTTLKNQVAIRDENERTGFAFPTDGSRVMRAVLAERVAAGER